MYSTPSKYIDALNSLNVTWPTSYYDMVPYSDDDQSFWTGFYTSRANSKKIIRDNQHNLIASTKLSSMKVID